MIRETISNAIENRVGGVGELCAAMRSALLIGGAREEGDSGRRHSERGGGWGPRGREQGVGATPGPGADAPGAGVPGRSQRLQGAARPRKPVGRGCRKLADFRGGVGWRRGERRERLRGFEGRRREDMWGTRTKSVNMYRASTKGADTGRTGV
ncbi:hypothetical protein Sm713_02210 [Streptomyces sp. TS71-3]|nr:hypothetical protein Sm713_02210 [Streptomyces sp. TS71-3]